MAKGTLWSKVRQTNFNWRLFGFIISSQSINIILQTTRLPSLCCPWMLPTRCWVAGYSAPSPARSGWRLTSSAAPPASSTSAPSLWTGERELVGGRLWMISSKEPNTGRQHIYSFLCSKVYSGVNIINIK